MSQKAKLQNTMDAMQVSTLEILNVNQQRIYLLQNQHNYKAFYFRFLEASRRQQLIQHEVLRRHHDFRDEAHSLPDVRGAVLCYRQQLIHMAMGPYQTFQLFCTETFSGCFGLCIRSWPSKPFKRLFYSSVYEVRKPCIFTALQLRSITKRMASLSPNFTASTPLLITQMLVMLDWAIF